jgi:hypothetical protein
MADRSTELRALMKGSSTGGATLTGKDKAKALKALKEKKKAEEEKVSTKLDKEAVRMAQAQAVAASLAAAGSKPVKKVTTALVQQPSSSSSSSSSLASSSAAIAKPMASAAPIANPLLGLADYSEEDDEDNDNDTGRSNFQSSSASTGTAAARGQMGQGLPSDFFDSDPIPARASSAPLLQDRAKATSQLSTDRPAGKVDPDYDPDEEEARFKDDGKKKGRTGASFANPNLPRGFFDNPMEDKYARGIDVQKLVEIKEKKVQDELKSFLGEIQELPDMEEDDPDEEALREAEEAAIQYAYVNRLALLMHASDNVGSKRGDTNKNVAVSSSEHKGNEIVQAALKDSNELHEIASSSSGGLNDLNNSSIESEVERVMAQKRLEKKKRKLEEKALLEGDIPDGDPYSIDWNAREFL